MHVPLRCVAWQHLTAFTVLLILRGTSGRCANNKTSRMGGQLPLGLLELLNGYSRCCPGAVQRLLLPRRL
jgi:hypothetical protein